MAANTSAEVVADLPKQEGVRVYVGNLPYSATEEQIRALAASGGGAISSVVVPLKYGKRPAGYAFVQYDKEEDAQKAVEKLNDTELDGRKLRFEIARPEQDAEERKAKRNALRKEKRAAQKEKAAAEGGAAPKTEGETSAEAPVAAEGDKPKRKPKKRSGKSTSRRRVPGEDGEDVEGASDDVKDSSAARIDGAGAEGAVKPKKERKPREKKLAPSGAASKDTLFVSNLPYDLDDEGLSGIFTNLSIGVKSSTILRSTFRSRAGKDASGAPRSRGFGFVVVENQAQLAEAVEKAAGTLVSGRTIGVKVANEMEPVEKDQVEKAAAADAAPAVPTPDKPAA